MSDIFRNRFLDFLICIFASQIHYNQRIYIYESIIMAIIDVDLVFRNTLKRAHSLEEEEEAPDVDLRRGKKRHG